MRASLKRHLLRRHRLSRAQIPEPLCLAAGLTLVPLAAYSKFPSASGSKGQDSIRGCPITIKKLLAIFIIIWRSRADYCTLSRPRNGAFLRRVDRQSRLGLL